MVYNWTKMDCSTGKYDWKTMINLLPLIYGHEYLFSTFFFHLGWGFLSNVTDSNIEWIAFIRPKAEGLHGHASWKYTRVYPRSNHGPRALSKVIQHFYCMCNGEFKTKLIEDDQKLALGFLNHTEKMAPFS